MRRIPELDALRGLSALLIVALHLGLGPTCPAFARAVDLFFVLSGYLITATILEHRGPPASSGTSTPRRALRIWPIYYLALLGFAFVVNPIRRRPHRLDGLWAHLTYTQNLPYYWGDRIPPFSPWFRHTWTLAIEEQFYLLWPLLAMRAGRRWLAVAALALIAGPIAARTQWPPWLLLTRSDGFAFGALLAIVPAGSFARIGSAGPRCSPCSGSRQRLPSSRARRSVPPSCPGGRSWAAASATASPRRPTTPSAARPSA